MTLHRGQFLDQLELLIFGEILHILALGSLDGKNPFLWLVPDFKLHLLSLDTFTEKNMARSNGVAVSLVPS